MKVSEHISKAEKTLFSFEILPPLKGKSINDLFDQIEPLMEFKPAFIDVTYHREEYVYKKRENGLLERKSVRKRPGTVAICAAIQNKFHVDAIPHIICGGFSADETENALIDLNFLGIENIMVLRGDPVKSENKFVPEEGGHYFASDLLKQINNLKNGIYLDEDLLNQNPMNFCMGVAAYPEKHFEAPNMNTDIKYLKYKVDCGADYIVTQMFFDNNKYFEFVKNCRLMQINVPIIPGIKPITSKKQIYDIPKTFHIDIPEDLFNAVENAKNNEEACQIGIEWAIMQSKDLIKNNAPSIHYFTMSKSQEIRRIASCLY